MSLTMIVAASENDVIGLNGKVPWRIPEDMNRFRTLTVGHPVIMGRKTYDSLDAKFKPLPGRKNIILSSSLAPSSGIYVARTIEEALKLTEDQDSYVIGGSKVYEQFMRLVGRIELTRVHQNYEGDTFLPKINWDEWVLLQGEKHVDKKPPYSFLRYGRK